jgi:hypothetical protein
MPELHQVVHNKYLFIFPYQNIGCPSKCFDENTLNNLNIAQNKTPIFAPEKKKKNVAQSKALFPSYF